MERIEEKTFNEKLMEKQIAHNKKSKQIAKMFGANLFLYLAMLLPFVMVGFIWTDIGLPKFRWALMCDGVITVVLFFVAEYTMIQVGKDGGKLDDEYRRYHDIYIDLTKNVYKIGVSLLSPFCEWQIDKEYEAAQKERCRNIKIPYDDFLNTYSKMTDSELVERFGEKKAAKVRKIIDLEPIELTPEMILTDGKRKMKRGGISESGEDYIERKTKSKSRIVGAVFTAIFAVSIAFGITQDISFARVFYTVIKLFMMLFRMAVGYNTGAKSYNSVEVLHLQSKIFYEMAYMEYLDKKMYLAFGDKYGKIIITEDVQSEESESKDLCLNETRS